MLGENDELGQFLASSILAIEQGCNDVKDG